MSFPSTTPKVMVVGPFGNTDNNGSTEITIFYTEYAPIEITKVYITDDAGSAADNTNYLTMTLESGSTNTGGTTLFSGSTIDSGTSVGVINAGELWELTKTEGTVARGQYITFAIDDTGSNGGTARATDMMLIIYYVEGSPASE